MDCHQIRAMIITMMTVNLNHSLAGFDFFPFLSTVDHDNSFLQRKNIRKDLFKDVLEPSVVAFEDGILGAHIQRPALHQCILEAGMGKICNGL